MRPFLPAAKISLMLILLFVHFYDTCTAQLHGLGRARNALAARDPARPTPTIVNAPVMRNDISIVPILTNPVGPCMGNTCTTAAAALHEYTCDAARDDLSKSNNAHDFEVICNIDYPDQNIYPFILARSFENCLISCQEYNEDHNDTQCAGLVYAPERAFGADDCYLKSSLNEPASATIHLIGATLRTSIMVATSSPTSAVAADDQVSADSAANKHQLVTVTVKEVKELGSSTNNPSKQYVSHVPYLPMKLSADLTTPGLNLDLIHDYDMAGDTGVWSSKDFIFKTTLDEMKSIPHLSRDGGKGGMVNGTHIFLFCDTAVYSDGQFVAFVSSSVATDQDMNGLDDKPLTLVDHLGEWQDDAGRMRGFAPMTEGEEAYNKAVSGDGYRYAVWPESAPIQLNSTTSLIYASLVYDEVDMNNQDDYNLTYFGNTLLETRIDPKFGPCADRIVPQLFNDGAIPFGSLAGFRAWGQDGVGGNAGDIILFGKNSDPNHYGVFAARTDPRTYSNLSTYTYWNGEEWGNTMPDGRSLQGSMVDFSVVDLDIIYMPKSATFMMIYTVFPPDNKFYWRQLYPHPGTHIGVYPPYKQYGDDHWADTMLTGDWESKAHVLYTVPDPAVGSMYAGGVHAGYFGNEDITNGGDSILLTWTEHTGKSGDAPESGYAIKSARASVTYGRPAE
jgi:hypothetical protein